MLVTRGDWRLLNFDVVSVLVKGVKKRPHAEREGLN